MDIKDSVRVQGDPKGDRVLLDRNGTLILDSGDSRIAPFDDEDAPITIDPFERD